VEVTLSRWLLGALTVATLATSLAACGNDESETPTTTTASLACGADDLNQGVISSFKVEVISNEQARATYVLSKDGEVGVVVQRVTGFRRIFGLRRPVLRLVGRVPFGPQRSTVVEERTFDLPKEDGEPLAPGEYQLTLRAFESGKLNVGDPIDTKSACVAIE
jgi:hypothetical protein